MDVLGIFKKDKKKKKEKETSSEESTNKKLILLVIDSPSRNWKALIEKRPDFKDVRVEQAQWSQIIITSTPPAVPLVYIKPSGEGGETKQFNVNFVLVRQLVRGLNEIEDYTRVLYGLMISGVPAVNSLHSIYMCLEKPVVFGFLTDIARRVGKETFSLVNLTYYSHHNAMMFTPELPIVVIRICRSWLWKG